MNGTLKSTISTKPRGTPPFVFFLSETDELDTRPLFPFFTADEKKYIEGIKKDLKVLKEKEVRVLFMPVTRRKVILVGIGKLAEMTFAKAGLATRIAVQAARKEKLTEFAVFTPPMRTPAETREFYEVLSSNAVMANFDAVEYKTPPPGGFTFIKEIQNIVTKSDVDIKAGLDRGIVIGEEVNNTRTLSNTPGGDMTPAILVAHTRKAIKGLPIKMTVLDARKMAALKMGGVLGVGKGSDAPPAFIILEYRKGPASERPVVLAGKGVTFDTGGINLKPSDSVYEMHMDMSGGAAVIHTLIAAARLKLKKNIVVLVPAVENMLSGASYRPGDLLRTMNGKTIEVMNTDAEGRVILSDALEYAKRYKPALVVDVATLTGAAIIALGLRYSGLFTPNKELEERLRAIGQAVGDPVWPLPISKDYEDDIRGTFGDWANSTRKGTGGGASTAATFLWQFTKDANGKDEYPWAHIDIAPRMTSIEADHLAKGAAGAPVRLLVRMLEEG